MLNRAKAEQGRFPWLVACLGLLIAGLLLSTVSVSFAEGDEEDAEPKEETSGPKALDRLDEAVIVGGHAEDLFAKLARVESYIEKAVSAEAADSQKEASKLFRKGATTLRAMHRENILAADYDPMVRLQNLKPDDLNLERHHETWVHLSEYLVRWGAFLPMNLRQQWAQDLDVSASQELAALKREPSLDYAKEILIRYLFSSSAEEVLDIAIQLAFESRAFLDMARLASLFKETRPSDYRSEPYRHLAYMLALTVLGDEVRLAEEGEYVEGALAAETFKVGDEDLVFVEALKRLKSALSIQDEEELWIPSLKGMTRALRLSARPNTSIAHFYTNQPLVNERGVFMPVAKPVSYPYNSGNITPRGKRIDADMEIRWFPKLMEDQSRTLTMPGHRSAFYFTRARSRSRMTKANITYRAYGIAEASYYGRLDTFQEPSDQRLLISVMASSGAMGLPFSGSRIQIFDMKRDAMSLETLPIESDMPKIRDFKLGTSMGSRRKYGISAMHFGGTPVIDGDRFYILGCYPRGGSSEMHLCVFNLNAQTGLPFGALIETQMICAISNNNSRNSWNRQMLLAEGSTLTMKHGKLFAQTNAGTVACVDRETLWVDWVVAYPQAQAQNVYRGWGYSSYQAPLTMSVQAPKLSGATLVSAPKDGKRAFALDALSGAVYRTIRGGRRVPYATYSHLIGVKDGYAYFQSSTAIIAEPVSLRALARNAKGELASAQRVVTDEEYSFGKRQIGVRSRAMVVGDEIWLQGTKDLIVLDRFSLEEKATYPWPQWGEELKDEDGKVMAAMHTSLDSNCIRTMQLIPAERSPTGRPIIMRTDNRGSTLYPIEEPNADSAE